ncbi:MAG: SGNH/GDSL hydrolase family protein [Bdellovibrionota bacterium]
MTIPRVGVFAVAASVLFCVQAWSEGGILMIGDSLSVGRVSKTLQPLLTRELGVKTRIVASCGSRPRDWNSKTSSYETSCGYDDLSATRSEEIPYRDALKQPHATPKLVKLLAQEKPETIIIQQGTNMFWDLQDARDPKRARAEIRALLDQVFSAKPAPKKCLWIAPPDTSKWPSEMEDRLFHLISEEVSSRCRVFDSRTVTRYPVKPSRGADGIHYDQTFLGRSQQDHWSEAIVAAVKALDAKSKMLIKESPRESHPPRRSHGS